MFETGIIGVCIDIIVTRYEAAKNWKDDDLCLKIKVLKDINKNTISCTSYMSKLGEYEIHEGKSDFMLSLNNKICSCRAWHISGIPCKQATTVMVHVKIDPHNVVSTRYFVRIYKYFYNFSINPIHDKNQWPTYDNLTIVVPPTIKRGVGRPCENRRRKRGGDQKGKVQKLSNALNVAASTTMQELAREDWLQRKRM